MNLTIHERFKLLELMPQESDYAGILEIRRTTMLLSLTDSESTELEVKNVDGIIHFNPEKALTMITDVPMGEWMTNIFRVILREKDHEATLEPAEVTLFEKFIMDYE